MIRGMGLYTNGVCVDSGDSVTGDLPGSPQVVEVLRDMATRARETPGTFLWLGLAQPTKSEMAAIRAIFGFDDLHIEDALNPDQRTKVDRRGDYDFMVMKVLSYVDRTSDVETGQISVFIGDYFVLTVRLGPVGELSPVRARLEQRPDLLRHGAPSVVYAILDGVVDGYIDVVNEINTDIEQVEETIFSPQPSDPEVVYRLKRENLEVRRAAVPLTRVAEHLHRNTSSRMPHEFESLFEDIRDHLLRVRENSDTNDSLLIALLMAATAREDLQQNRDMRRISAWVAIAAVPTMIAGVYGMNFENMPELRWDFGYPLILLFMLTVCSLMYRAFKRSGWL